MYAGSVKGRTTPARQRSPGQRCMLMTWLHDWVALRRLHSLRTRSSRSFRYALMPLKLTPSHCEMQRTKMMSHMSEIGSQRPKSSEMSSPPSWNGKIGWQYNGNISQEIRIQQMLDSQNSAHVHITQSHLVNIIWLGLCRSSTGSW